MLRFALLFFLLDGFVLFSSCQRGPVVNTTLGSILGTVKSSRNRIIFYSFRGIQYAKPPKGSLRFKPPVPVEPWTGVLDATRDGPACFPHHAMESDCLHLNVYTRRVTADELRPVLVCIHGGVFRIGSGQSTFYGPEYLMNHDIVVVTLNYRIGNLGFFSTGDKYAPGNYGLKDQVAALKWVKNNIKAFGGDPEKVTLAGKEAGGASVGFHLISPMSRGLFHGAMILSGSPMNPWAFNKNPMKIAKRDAEKLGCPTDSSEKIVECMSKIPADGKMKQSISVSEGRLHAPVIEMETEGEERFLEKNPIVSLLEGDVADVPIYIGTTRYEELDKAFNMLYGRGKADYVSDHWGDIIPSVCLYDQNNTISNKLREFYFKKSPITQNSVDRLNDLISDARIIFGVVELAKLISEKNTNPVYLYQYNVIGKMVMHPRNRDLLTNEFMNKFDTCLMFFNQECLQRVDSQFDELRLKMTTMWKNFIETGNPTPDASAELDNVVWEPYTNDNPKYLNMNETFKMVDGIYFKDRIEFWESLFPLPDVTKEVNQVES